MGVTTIKSPLNHERGFFFYSRAEVEPAGLGSGNHSSIDFTSGLF